MRFEHFRLIVRYNGGNAGKATVIGGASDIKYFILEYMFNILTENVGLVSSSFLELNPYTANRNFKYLHHFLVQNTY